MAENCPSDCPNILDCDARVDGLQNRVVNLLKEESIVAANLSTLEAAEDNTISYAGRTFVVPPKVNVFTRDWSGDVQNDIRINSSRLVKAQQASETVRAAAETCETGPVPTLLGNLALAKATFINLGTLSPSQKTAELRRNPRYVKCGNKAAESALRHVPTPYES